MQRFRGGHARRGTSGEENKSAAAAEDLAGGSSTSSEPRARPATPQKNEDGLTGADSKNTPLTLATAGVPQRPRSQRTPGLRGSAQSDSSSEEFGSGSRTKRKASSARQPFSTGGGQFNESGTSTALLLLLDAAEELNRQQSFSEDSQLAAAKRFRQGEEATARDSTGEGDEEEKQPAQAAAPLQPQVPPAAAAPACSPVQQQLRHATPGNAFAVQPPAAPGCAPVLLVPPPALVLSRLADGMVAQLVPVVGDDPQMLSRALFAYARSCQLQGRAVEAEAAVVRSWELFCAAAGSGAAPAAVAEAFERMKRDVGAVLVPQFGHADAPPIALVAAT